jgi:peptidoglycan hydrolase-like protein with peptidoglycan-binding domain
MRRSASRLEEPSGLGDLFREGLVLTGGAIVRNPVIAGGSTAFLVALAFVTANAIWYQPHQHPGAFFTTREPVYPMVPVPLPEPRPAPRPQVRDTTILIERESTASVPNADPQVLAVQQVLRDLKLYTGTVDGLTGPQTAKAVEAYQQLVGLQATGKIDGALLRQLGAGGQQQVRPAESLPEAFVSADPSTTPLPQARPEAASVTQVAAHPSDPHIVRIQAGLKAFGNDGIELDGVVGPKTKSAIREFQSLFGLPETGEPDAAVYAKMREIGLTD